MCGLCWTLNERKNLFILNSHSYWKFLLPKLENTAEGWDTGMRKEIRIVWMKSWGTDFEQHTCREHCANHKNWKQIKINVIICDQWQRHKLVESCSQCPSGSPTHLLSPFSFLNVQPVDRNKENKFDFMVIENWKLFPL